ncbi:putative HD superfamily hydrolase of NAD metabolism [Ruminococcus sp. YE71]|uniref:bis(5'-nucleosyl)-tetraphosphatase (symmetrical) YqeK n=1 Tax=unclassified Ruminococcus TaxID=2608920 RepID=UPI00087F66ED|nr:MULTISPECIES: bis(5'-nucleosyl)-tetraphosphatase (symmetrical) YqeK [unclassified Ruminococcus]SDA16006.1 putative HD superfamily hydrolase of NAD metabolism [Ruminococcus sp. YE78]SFW23698.1 putative HD superfamily hydrolase of NAD metabolism [Ruminococcus sp. YE71]
MAKELNKYKDFLKANLSKKRYVHSLNVAAMSRELAELYGEDKERAYFAGLIHDIAKELPRERQFELASRCKIAVSQIELKSTPLLHAVAGAQLLMEEFGLTLEEDRDILEAVRYHTVGAAGMSKLAQIVYLADLTSEDREYKDVKKYRKYAHTSLDKGMYEALRYSIADSALKGNTIPISTLEAYNEILSKK